MTKENHKFDVTADFEKIDLEERETLSRRIQTYSVDALKEGLPASKILVQHSLFNEGLKALDRVFQLSKEVTMPHGLSIVGPTGVGKSALIFTTLPKVCQNRLYLPPVLVVSEFRLVLVRHLERLFHPC